MASAVTQPLGTPAPRVHAPEEPAHARGGILWIAIGGILLAGVVFVNVAVLQLNLRLDSANAERSKLLADNAALQTQYSSAHLVAPHHCRGEEAVRARVPDPSEYVYVDLAKK